MHLDLRPNTMLFGKLQPISITVYVLCIQWFLSFYILSAAWLLLSLIAGVSSG